MIGWSSGPHVKRVVVLVEETDGTQRGFEVFDAKVRWEWTGVVHHGGSTARLEASGVFHRVNHPGDGLAGIPTNELEQR